MPQIDFGNFNPNASAAQELQTALDFFYPKLNGETSLQQRRRWLRAAAAEMVTSYRRSSPVTADAGTVLPD